MSASENPKGKSPLTMKIKFKSTSLEQFIERYSVDVSRGGIFIRTKEPQSIGTQIKFEFQLQDGSPLIVEEGVDEGERGKGKVENRGWKVKEKKLAYLHGG